MLYCDCVDLRGTCLLTRPRTDSVNFPGYSPCNWLRRLTDVSDFYPFRSSPLLQYRGCECFCKSRRSLPMLGSRNISEDRKRIDYSWPRVKILLCSHSWFEWRGFACRQHEIEANFDSGNKSLRNVVRVYRPSWGHEKMEMLTQREYAFTVIILGRVSSLLKTACLCFYSEMVVMLLY